MAVFQQEVRPTGSNAVFTVEVDDSRPDDDPVAIGAVIDGQEVADPQGLWVQALAYNRTVTALRQRVADILPADMKKDVLDSDGDPTGQVVIKDKHEPVISFDSAGAAQVEVPGAPADVAAMVQAQLDGPA